MITIHMMQCMYMYEMPSVMNGMNTDSKCCLEKNSKILQQTVKRMTVWTCKYYNVYKSMWNRQSEKSANCEDKCQSNDNN